MKKILVLLLMFTLFSAVSCDDDEGGVGGEVRLQDLDSVQIYPAEGTEAEGVGDKFTSVLSRSASGWSAYRWTTSTTEDMPETDNDAMDCDGAYKVSYFEEASAAENVHRFVGGGMCLNSDNSDKDTERVEVLRGNVNEYLDAISTTITNTDDDDDVYDKIETAYTAHETSKTNDENGEYYLFVAELKLTEEEDQTIMGTLQQVTVMLDEPAVTVLHHPDPDLEGENIYELTDDSGNAFIKEVVDELANLEPAEAADPNDQELINEGVWNVYTFPKEGDSDTLNDPPKLSYFRIANGIGAGDRRFIVGAGIYLDVNNPNATSNRLEQIRSKVREAAALLLAGEEDGELPEMFFDDDADTSEEFQQVVGGIVPTDDEAYIFVWENR